MVSFLIITILSKYSFFVHEDRLATEFWKEQFSSLHLA